MAVFQDKLVSRYENVSILDIIGVKDDGGWVTTGAIRYAKLQSNHHHQQNATYVLSVIHLTVSKH